jgi:hypothetical protein
MNLGLRRALVYCVVLQHSGYMLRPVNTIRLMVTQLAPINTFWHASNIDAKFVPRTPHTTLQRRASTCAAKPMRGLLSFEEVFGHLFQGSLREPQLVDHRVTASP